MVVVVFYFFLVGGKVVGFVVFFVKYVVGGVLVFGDVDEVVDVKVDGGDVLFVDEVGVVVVGFVFVEEGVGFFEVFVKVVGVDEGGIFWFGGFYWDIVEGGF